MSTISGHGAVCFPPDNPNGHSIRDKTIMSAKGSKRPFAARANDIAPRRSAQRTFETFGLKPQTGKFRGIAAAKTHLSIFQIHLKPDVKSGQMMSINWHRSRPMQSASASCPGLQTHQLPADTGNVRGAGGTWPLTSLYEPLIKTGTRLACHAHYASPNGQGHITE